MKKVFLILVTLILSYPCLSQTGHHIPIDSKNNRTYITLKIGDLIIPDVLLDTGFAFDGLILFKPAYRDSLDVTGASSVQIGGAGSGDEAGALMIDSVTFSLGDITLDNHPLIIMSQSPGFASDGLIGYSIFGHFITEFDYDNNIMTLHEGEEISLSDEWSSVPLYFKNNNIPWLDASVSINGEALIKMSMYIDFAAGDELVLLEKPGMKFTTPPDADSILLGRGLSGDVYGRKGRVARVLIGDYEVENLEASFAPAEVRSRQDNADAIVGNMFLKRFDIIFDYNRNELYLKPNEHFSDSTGK